MSTAVKQVLYILGFDKTGFHNFWRYENKFYFLVFKLTCFFLNLIPKISIFILLLGFQVKAKKKV